MLALAFLVAPNCPAFDLLDSGPNDLDPDDWSAADSLALQPDLAGARLAGRLSFTSLPPVAFTFTDGFDPSLAEGSRSVRRAPGQGFAARQRRTALQRYQGHSGSTMASSASAADPV
jgi:hypothetical protein